MSDQGPPSAPSADLGAEPSQRARGRASGALLRVGARAKSSAFVAVTVSGAGIQVEQCVERGGTPGGADQGFPGEPLPPRRLRAPGRRWLEAAGARLFEAASANAGDHGALAVRVVSARVVESDQDGGRSLHRLVSVAEWRVGANPALPVWVRVAPLDLSPRAPERARWPTGFPEAARRALPGRLPPGPRPVSLLDEDALVLDAFAASDLVRGAALGWARHECAGSLVASAALDVEDLGPRWIGKPTNRDAVGDRARGGPVVRRGTLVALPRGAGHRVRASWRESVQDGWHSLRAIAPSAAWPRDALVITSVIGMGPGLFGAGFRMRDARPVERFDPVPIPPAAWWLSRVAAALGPPVEDATGLPCAVPPLLIEPDGATAPASPDSR